MPALETTKKPIIAKKGGNFSDGTRFEEGEDLSLKKLSPEQLAVLIEMNVIEVEKQ